MKRTISTCARVLLVGGALQVAIRPFDAASQPVKEFGLATGKAWQQTNDTITLLTGTNAYGAEAWTVSYSGGSLYAVESVTPAGSVKPLPVEAGYTNFLRCESFPAQTNLTAAYPAGLYAFRFWQPDQLTPDIPLLVSSNSFPSAAHLANYIDAQAIDPDSDFDLLWDLLAGNPESGTIQVSVRDQDGNLRFETPAAGHPGALPANTTIATIPAGTLCPQSLYQGQIRYVQWISVISNTPAGATARVGVFSDLRFNLATVGAWSTNLSFAFRILTPTNLPTQAVGEASTVRLMAFGRDPAAGWMLLSGQLPPGLALETNTGAIRGYPQAAGTYSFQVRAIDPASNAATQALHLVVTGAVSSVRMLTTNLTQAVAGLYYSAALQCTNGVPPYQWRLTGSSSLPNGLSLAADIGLISGSATQSGTFPLDLEVADAFNQRDHRVCTLAVQPGQPVSIGKVDSFRLRGNGTAELAISTDPFYQVVIESSSNLTSWTTLLTTNLPNYGPIRIPISTGQSKSFYRFRQGSQVVFPSPLNVQPITDPTRSVAGLLGPNGGMLVLTNAQGVVFTLNIPSNSLARLTPIRMTALLGLGGLPAGSQVLGAVQLTPEGTDLWIPATLKIQTPTAIPAGVNAFSTAAAGQDFHLTSARITNNQATISLPHFSSPGVGTVAGGAGDTVPCDIEAYFKQKLARFFDTLPAQPDETDLSNFLEIFGQWYQTVKTRWLQPAQHDYTISLAAARAYASWRKELSWGNLDLTHWDNPGPVSLEDRFAAERAEGNKLVAGAMKVAIQSFADSCTRNKDPWAGIIAKAYFNLSQQLQAANYSDRIDMLDKVVNCLRFDWSTETWSHYEEEHWDEARKDHKDVMSALVTPHQHGVLTPRVLTKSGGIVQLDSHYGHWANNPGSAFAHPALDDLQWSPHQAELSIVNYGGTANLIFTFSPDGTEDYYEQFQPDPPCGFNIYDTDSIAQFYAVHWVCAPGFVAWVPGTLVGDPYGTPFMKTWGSNPIIGTGLKGFKVSPLPFRADFSEEKKAGSTATFGIEVHIELAPKP